jgi:hypothetical protein
MMFATSSNATTPLSSQGAADLGGNLLYDDHERETEHKGPRQTEAKLCSDLTVRRNPTGIIVRRSRY